MLELDIQDMTCGHCASTITRAVKDVDAGAQLDIDLGKHRVTIESAKAAEEFLAAIREAGYTPVQAGS
jgi:copper chaperone